MEVTQKIEISDEKAAIFKEAANKFGTPIYCYFEDEIIESMNKLMEFPAPYGLTIRFAMKANPNMAILKLFDKLGAHIDAGSSYEAYRAIMGAGINASYIRLTGQLVPEENSLEDLVNLGVHFTACSLTQLELYGRLFPGTEVGIRFNIGIGSGGTKKTTTGGPDASFGIYEQGNEIDKLLAEYGLRLETIHMHIGSGSDPEKQIEADKKVMELVKYYGLVKTLNIGGGFKVARMPYEKSTDILEIGSVVSAELQRFYQETGRKIHLEIEPGTYAIANAGYIIARVNDIISTNHNCKDGHVFIKSNSGMTENTRVSLYGAQHPMSIIPMNGEIRGTKEYVVSGPCCESGDVLTVKPNNPEEIIPRKFTEARRGDLLVIGGCGAYCSSMSTANYNSYPKPAEVLVRNNGRMDLIRIQQASQKMWEDERMPGDL